MFTVSLVLKAAVCGNGAANFIIYLLMLAKKIYTQSVVVRKFIAKKRVFIKYNDRTMCTKIIRFFFRSTFFLIEKTLVLVWTRHQHVLIILIGVYRSKIIGTYGVQDL